MNVKGKKSKNVLFADKYEYSYSGFKKWGHVLIGGMEMGESQFRGLDDNRIHWEHLC